jgi:hypothetical protein
MGAAGEGRRGPLWRALPWSEMGGRYGLSVLVTDSYLQYILKIEIGLNSYEE